MAVHTFKPSHYHVAIGSHAPVLTIQDGDTVVTTCVDARGQDQTAKPVTEPGNPQTGPFFVAGAEPGDSIAITFDKMYPNRDTGWTRAVVAGNVVDPSFVHRLPTDLPLVIWNLDRAAGTARPSVPLPGLESLVLPLDPMLGCFGVAPPRGQAISTGTSSTHGGNMDYRGFKQGVTVFFPVHVPGALIHVGDGHAVQGDGEIVGTGIETSFDVQFTVRLHKGKTIEWPRADNGTEILTAGNARPLDQALQHATTEMLRWLEADYGLALGAASTLLGQVVRYEIGNVFDPAYTVICKIDKRWLPAR